MYIFYIGGKRMWKEKIEEIIKRYEEITEKRKKINALLEVLRQLKEEGIIGEYEENVIKQRINWIPTSGNAYITIPVSSELQTKLEEVMQYLLTSKYKVSSIDVEVSTRELRFTRAGSTEEKAKELGIDYAGYKDGYGAGFMDYFLLGTTEVDGVTVFVYLVVTNYTESDC